MKDQSTVALRNSNSVKWTRMPRNRAWRLDIKQTQLCVNLFICYLFIYLLIYYLFPFNVAVSTSDCTSSHGSMIQ